MNYGVLGTGIVGRTIAGKLAAQGHRVMIGSREAGNAAGAEWAKSAGPTASFGSFSQTAAQADIVFLCVGGTVAVEVVQAAAGQLAGKILIDVTNPLDFSKGMPPSLFAGNTDSLAERIQAAVPAARVVKSLNTVTADLMVDPGRVAGGDHAIFTCGDDPTAKAAVAELLQSWGWKQVVDLGDITTARGTESYLPLWLRLWGALGTPYFNVRIVR